MPTFREPCSPLHQSEEQLDTELFLRVIPFLYITLFVGVLERKKKIVGGGREERWGKSVFNNRENSFPYFIYVACLLSINKTMVSDTQSDKKILSILSYIKETTNRINRILNKHNIRTIFKSSKKIGEILRNPKNQRLPLNSARVYKIPCSCGQVYIGEIGRMINLEIKEH